MVSAWGHFGLIWIVISFFILFINLYHYGRVGQYECVRVVRDVKLGVAGCSGWDRLGRYTKGMMVYLPWVR